jgi:hypothetical protein
LRLSRLIDDAMAYAPSRFAPALPISRTGGRGGERRHL